MSDRSTSAPTGIRQRLGGTWTVGVFVMIALLAIAPVLVFATVTVRVASDAVHDQVDTQVQASALASANVVEQQVGRLADVVEARSDEFWFEKAVDARDVRSVRTMLGSLAENRSDVQLAFVVDPSGILLDVVPETPAAIGQDFSGRDWYRGVTATGQTYVSEAYETAAVGTPLVFVAVTPVTSPVDPSKVIGYVGVGQSLETLQGYVDRFADSQGVALTITDQAGTILSAPGGAVTEITTLEDHASITSGLSGSSEVRDATRDGQRLLASTAPVPSIGWHVTADVPAESALVGVWRVTATVVIVGAMLTLMVLVGVAVLARSLRRRQEAVEEQARSEAFLRSIIDHIPSIVMVKDAETLRIERVNPAAERVLGVDAGDLLGKSDAELVEAAVAEVRMAQDRHVLEHGEIVDIALDEMITSEGPRQFRTRKIPIRPDDDVPGFLLTIGDDVTDSVAALNELQEAKSEAERANAAKSDFLSKMSHELRTPLNAVIGFGQLLEIDDPTPQQAESIEQILHGGRHLLGLINEILDLARIETGRLSMSLEPVEVESVADEALDLVRPLAAETGIEVPAVLVGDWSHRVVADRQRIKQVLINLLANAVKYNRPHGRIDLACVTSGDRLRIEVIDTGPGVTPEQQSAMFSPFERLGADATGVEGTGLGLSLSKSLVEAMGGSIGVEAELGVGSTFWIDLGVAAPEASQTFVNEAVAPQLCECSEATVLYIEDNDSNLLLVERILSTCPEITLLTATTGEEGLDLAAEHDPDLVLLDLNLPGIDGHEVVRRLRARHDVRRVPIVVLSADATKSGVSRLLEGGADHFLSKPIDVDALMATIDGELAAATS